MATTYAQRHESWLRHRVEQAELVYAEAETAEDEQRALTALLFSLVSLDAFLTHSEQES
jgi:hypothetical protein